MPAGWRFVIYEDYSGRYGWRLYSAASRLMAESVERFEQPGQARSAAESVRSNAGWADIKIELPRSKLPQLPWGRRRVG
jgi:uncharacterized protein YegP (UPF0339 family)